MNSLRAAASIARATSNASNFANQTVETARTEVLKEPLGFIKILQFIIAIITFSVAVNGGDTITVTTLCPIFQNLSGVSKVSNVSKSVSATYGFPYDLSSTFWEPTWCNSTSLGSVMTSSASIVASSGFFVFVGVMSFLYSLAFMIIYIFFRHKYDNLVFFPIADFILTILTTVFWFAASIAWSKAIVEIKNALTASTLFSASAFITCHNITCSYVGPKYNSFDTACVFGFGNFILWFGNSWFTYKETAWYKNRALEQQQQQQQQQQQVIES